MPPTSGAATVNGFDIFHQSQTGRETGLRPRIPRPLPRDEGRGVPRLSRAAARDGPSRTRRQADRLRHERVWAGHGAQAACRPAVQGISQRVGLADEHIAPTPAGMVLDEPTVGLDPTQIRERASWCATWAGPHGHLFERTLTGGRGRLRQGGGIRPRARGGAGGRREIRASRRMREGAGRVPRPGQRGRGALSRRRGVAKGRGRQWAAGGSEAHGFVTFAFGRGW